LVAGGLVGAVVVAGAEPVGGFGADVPGALLVPPGAGAGAGPGAGADVDGVLGSGLLDVVLGVVVGDFDS
jgi:hypothetical protein